MIFSLVLHVHKNNLGHCCNHLCYAVSEFEDQQSSPNRWNSSHNHRAKSPLVLGLVIFRTMEGNHLFQSTCLESIRLKTDGHCFQNVGVLHPTGPIHHKATVALCIVLTFPGINCLHGCFMTEKQSIHHATPHVNFWRICRISSQSFFLQSQSVGLMCFCNRSLYT
jgi:hypothetical protein